MVDETATLGGSLNDVRAFCAVVELGTISAAARLTGETKGGVSRRLSRLERRLGVALLARTPRAVSPTEEGTDFYTSAREALTWLDDAAEGARQSRSVPQGHLRVTAPVDLSMDVLPELVVRFRALHPQITVELLVTDTALDLAANRIDLALRVPVGGLPDMGYRALPLIDYRIGLYAAPAYLAAHGEPGAPGELSGHEVIIGREPGGTAQLSLYDRRGRSERVSTRPVMRTTDYANALRLAIAGGGVAALPEVISAGAVTADSLVQVLPEWSLAQARLYAISLCGRDSPARVRVFRDFLRTELARQMEELRRRSLR